MKQCSRCQEVKSLDEFQKRSKNKDGRTGMCKPCKREYDNSHYKATPARRGYIRENAQKHIRKTQDFILDYLQIHPCVDCGETDPVVLEFDHLGDKRGSIGDMTRRNGINKVREEIAKCEVRCANCHRRKTAKTFGWYRILEEV